MRASHKHLLLPLVIFAIVMLIGTAGDWSMSARLAVAALFSIAADAAAAMVRQSRHLLQSQGRPIH